MEEENQLSKEKVEEIMALIAMMPDHLVQKLFEIAIPEINSWSEEKLEKSGINEHFRQVIRNRLAKTEREVQQLKEFLEEF